MPDHFHTTCWTQVLAAQSNATEAPTALAELCKTYYQPVRAFIHQVTQQPAQVDDLTQEFFALVLRGASLRAQRAQGKFRSYLLGAVKHFLSNQKDRNLAEKRGGGIAPVSLSAMQEEPDADVWVESITDEDAIFDREWGFAVLARAIAILADDFQQRGSSEHFEKLKPWLMGAHPTQTQASLASELQISETALRVAIHRLRQRFREAVKSEIAKTVTYESEVKAELNYLIAIVTR